MMAAGFLALACVAPAAAGRAQSRDDSLAIRLRQAEAAIETLNRQVSELSESAPRAASGAKLVVSGRVALHAFGNARRVNNVDNPQFVLQDRPAPARGGGMSMRQSRLKLALSGLPSALGAEVGADVDVDFYGGQLPSPGGRHFPLVRLRTARAFMWWRSVEAMIGQAPPLIAGLNPESPGAVGTPDFAAAGNLWLWTPQIRFGTRAANGRWFGIQGAVLAPTSGDPAAAFDTENDVAELSSRPFLQARAFVRRGGVEAGAEPSELGCGVHQGWLMPARERVSSFAFACDLSAFLTPVLEVRGEFFQGRGIRGLGGGAIGQNLNARNEPVESTGGWLQANVGLMPSLRMGAGCGGDHPRNASARLRNDACAAYVMTRPSPEGGLFAGAEFRRIRTEYAVGRFTNDHVTLALGFEF